MPSREPVAGSQLGDDPPWVDQDVVAVRSSLAIKAQQLDHGVEIFKSSALPAIEGYDGFCSVSLLTNQESGRAVVSVTFDSRDAMDCNRDVTSRKQIAQ